MDRRLDSQLVRVVERLTSSTAAEIARSIPLSVGDYVPVTIRFDGAPEALESALAQLGIGPVNRGTGVFEVYVPVPLLVQVASLVSVTHVGLIAPPVMDAISQGAYVHNATTWQGGGYTGAGVKVGVIDVGFQGLMSLLGTELPSSVIARCYTGVGIYYSTPSTCDAYTPHGTAVAEALGDVAPGVQLYIANPMSSLDLRNTVQWMTSLGVSVINHSVSWSWTGPGDGTSPYSDAPVYSVDAAVNNGATWTNSASNAARATWSGPFVDLEGNGVLNFVAGAELNGVSLEGGACSSRKHDGKIHGLLQHVIWTCISWTARLTLSPGARIFSLAQVVRHLTSACPSYLV